MKKTVAALAITASSSAFGLVGPQVESKTVCLRAGITQDRLIYAGSCDEARNNKILNKRLLKNGCAKGQIALTATRYSYRVAGNAGQAGAWDPQVRLCMRPNVVQL